MEDTLLNWFIGLLMAYPPVTAAAGTIAGFMLTMFVASRAAEAVGISLRPIAKVIPGDKDNRLLEQFIWWMDALADMSEPLARMKFRRGWSVFERVRVDYKKPLPKRRWQDGPVKK